MWGSRGIGCQHNQVSLRAYESAFISVSNVKAAKFKKNFEKSDLLTYQSFCTNLLHEI